MTTLTTAKELLAEITRQINATEHSLQVLRAQRRAVVKVVARLASTRNPS